MNTSEQHIPLNRDPAFWGLNLTQFLGAFNDNLFKQMVMLLAVGPVANLQGIALALFSAPFVLLSGVSGVLADRNSKRTIIVQSKVLEIVAMALGAVAFWFNSLPAMFAVLFLMGAQSAYFGPAKYGILPELFRADDLPRANGSVLMMTFLSIILGVTLAGWLLDAANGQIWLGSVACVGIAILGTYVSTWIRRTPVAQPDLPITPSSFAIPPAVRQELAKHPVLFRTLIATSVFWCVGGIYMAGVNDLGKLQLGLSDSATSLLQGCASIGIGVGCVVAGRLSHGRFDARLVYAGIWGMIVCLVVLATPPGRNGPLLGQTAASIVLVVLGFCAGLFAVPIQVFLQAMAPDDQKGQVIGTMNLLNWIGILLAGGIHFAVARTLAAMNWPPATVFAVGALLLLLMAAFFHPRSQILFTESDVALADAAAANG